MSIEQTVTFTEDVKVEDHLGEITFEAKAGDVVKLPATSCTRWIRRNKAVAGEPKKPAADPKAGKEKPASDKPEPKK